MRCRAVFDGDRLTVFFFPDTAQAAFGIVLSDRGTAMLHGFGNLVMAFLIYLTAANLETYRGFVPVFQAFAGGEALIFAFQLLSGMHTFAEVARRPSLDAFYNIAICVWEISYGAGVN